MAEQNVKTGEAFTGAEAMYTTEFEGASQYKRPSCFELAGQTFDFVFDDGRNVLARFIDGRNVEWIVDGQPEFHRYECLKATDLHYLVHFEKAGRFPREAVTLIVDVERDLVTGNFVTQGADPSYVNLVKRTVVFGAIRRPGRPLPTERHEHTRDLVGKKVEWTYSPVFRIIHIYYSDRLCRGAMPADMRAKLPKTREYKLFEEEAIYLRISNGVYVFSWIEKNFGSGTQGFMLMDTHRIHDVGLFFGVNPDGKPESYMLSANGRYVTEDLPEEAAPSPYTYDWE